MFAFAANRSSTRGHPLKLVKLQARVNGQMFFFSLRIADVVTSNTYNQFKRGVLNVNLDKFLTVI
jgi:hypothetical protein